jgi:multidrug efflux pump subunit AcrA (membrane-fusion protein)
MNKYAVIGLVAALALAGAGYVSFAGGKRAPAPAKGVAATKPVAARIVAQAEIEPVQGIAEIRTLVEGTVRRVHVREGERVAQGQIVAELDNAPLAATVARRAAELNAAAERLAMTQTGARAEDQGALEAALEGARRDEQAARDKWERQQKLWGTRNTTEQAATAARLAHEAALARRAEAEARAAAAKSGRPEAIKEAAAALAAARAALNEAEEQLARTIIRAPRAGVVLDRLVHPGDTVGLTAASPVLMRIAEPNEVEARAEIETLFADKIALGQKAILRLAGDSRVVATGRVVRIAADLKRRRIGADDNRLRADARVRNAWIALDPGANGALPPIGLRLEAFIALGEQGK